MTDYAIGIDIGGTSIKGSLVDLQNGDFFCDEIRVQTPEVASPENIVKIIGGIVDELEKIADNKLDIFEPLPIGVGCPGLIQNGTVIAISNLHESFVGTNMPKLFEKLINRKVSFINDADAAGYGESVYSSSANRSGLVFTLTLGTGIGTALINNGVLIPSSELGLIEIPYNGVYKSAEKLVAGSVKTNENLSWEEFTKRLQTYLELIELFLSPAIIIIGGGISAEYEKFIPHLKLRAEVIPATLRNKAGIIGAANFASCGILKTKIMGNNHEENM